MRRWGLLAGRALVLAPTLGAAWFLFSTGSAVSTPGSLTSAPTAQATVEPSVSPTTAMPAPSQSDLAPQVAELNRKVSEQGATLTQYIASLNSVLDLLRWLLGGLALGLTGVVVIQSYFQKRHDEVQLAGVEKVTDIMGVVHSALDGRLTEEKNQRMRADTLETTLKEFKEQLRRATERGDIQDRIIRREREAIEAGAQALADTSRHAFRGRIDDLLAFARRFDTFKTQYEPMEEEVREFSAKVLYVRGIAAAYANEPGTAQEYLTTVTNQATVGAEPQDTVDRRIAVAFFYLGIIKSNFGHVIAAADSFSAARQKYPKDIDNLTAVVEAEALAMGGRIADARARAQEIEENLDARYRNGVLPFDERRLRSRAILIQANAAILEGHRNYIQVVTGLLTPVLEQDPDYYYARVTMAQVKLASNDSAERPIAETLLQSAYEDIIVSNHRYTLVEARSKILLYMTAGLCQRLGVSNLAHADEHLSMASRLLGSLPRMGPETCTVFSVLTKRNEGRQTIEEHIRAVRDGQALLPGRFSSAPAA
jgi:hypothetical protein